MDNYGSIDTETLMKEFQDMTFDNILEGIGIMIESKTDNSCPGCGSFDFVEDSARGMIVCKCGQVIDDIIDDGAEKRFYDDEDGPARCAVPHNKLLPQSSLGTTVNVSGKLRKLQTWCAMPYKERSNNILYKRIDAICTEFKIPGMVKYDAQLICMKVSIKEHSTGDNAGKPIITRGRNRAGIVAGCLYIACRKNRKYARSAREIADYFNINEANINKGVSAIQSILKDDPIIKDIGTCNVTDFIKRKCDEIRIRNVNALKAMTIGNNIERLGIASNHTTYALAAASILLMADIDGLTHITKKFLSEYFSKLTDVTIGKTYNQVQNLREILISDAITVEILRRINLKRKRRVITKEVAQKMRDFDVDTSKYIIEGEENNSVGTTTNNLELSDKLTDEDTDSINDSPHQIINEYDFDITMDDICELVLEIRSEMESAQMKTGEEREILEAELLEKRNMVIQFVKEYPETLDQKGIDVDFFLNEFCTIQDREEILYLREEDNQSDLDFNQEFEEDIDSNSNDNDKSNDNEDNVGSEEIKVVKKKKSVSFKTKGTKTKLQSKAGPAKKK